MVSRRTVLGAAGAAAVAAIAGAELTGRSRRPMQSPSVRDPEMAQGEGRLQEIGAVLSQPLPTLAPGIYRTRPADALLDLAGVVAHDGGASPSGDPANGLHGINPYSYPEALVPLIAAAGLRWVRLDVMPGNGSGSLGSFVWDGRAVTPVATANDRALYTLYARHGVKAMVGVSDSRSLTQLRTYAAPGGLFESIDWWPGIIESLNENYNFLAYPAGAPQGQWVSGRTYAVGDVAGGVRAGGSWYCIRTHASSAATQMPDTVSGNGNLMDIPDHYWIPQWAYEQLWLNTQTTALRNRTPGLADTLIADGGNANDSYLPTLVYASQSLGLDGSLSADLFNIHDYANPSFGAVDNETRLPVTPPVTPRATTTGLIVLGETGVTCGIDDYASGNNLLLAWFEAYRLGNFDKAFGYQIMDDTGSYPTVVAGGVVDYGLLAPTPGTPMPFRGDPADFPITPKPGYTMVKNMLRTLADPGSQPPPRTVGFHFTRTTPPAVQPMLRRSGQIDIPVFTEPGYGTVNSPPAADASCTIVLDTLTARRFELYDPVTDAWTGSHAEPGQSTWSLEPGINRYPRLLRVTPG